MALLQLHALTGLTTTTFSSKLMSFSKYRVPQHPSLALPIQCFSAPTLSDQTIPKRSENHHYKPTIWDYDFVQSLGSSYVLDDLYSSQMEKLKKDVRFTVENIIKPLAQLESIDKLERLGVSHLFEEEITRSLQNVYNNKHKLMKESLYATSLCFRILRQHGYPVSQDVFKTYMDEKGNFKESLCKDSNGILSLYEASHLLIEGEQVLDEALNFTTKHLEKFVKGNTEPNLAKQVSRSLEIPLHWRMVRSEASCYMDAYENENNKNPALLELAKLDFNMVQATLQEDLRNISSWWKNIGVATKLTFARDRLVESFLWSVGIAYKPQYTECREWLTKVMNFVLIIDDIYDVYGSMDELEMFLDAVERWDYTSMEKLPYYMKLCFLALYNMTNEMAYYTLQEQGMESLPYLTKSWANFIKAMLVEAKWCKQGYTPSLEEYLSNGWLSSSGSVFLAHAFFATKQKITKETLDAIYENHNLIYCSSMMFRLSNDLATSSAELERGDVASSIHCYMHEMNASEEDARKHIKGLILSTWKKMNKSIVDSPFDRPFIDIALNLARTSLFIYQYGDGLGVEDAKSKEHILSLIVNPVAVSS